MDQLALSPENVALPEPIYKKRVEGPWGRFFTGFRKRKKSKKVPPTEPEAAPEILAYRASVARLAAHFPNFGNVAATKARHDWSPTIVLYDRIDSTQSLLRHEPWKGRGTAPAYQEFYKAMRNIPDNCLQRTILVEDLTPSLIDLLGATFHIPPHVFEEHLHHSGYKTTSEKQDKPDSWYPHSSAQDYSSITWYRPVLPLVPITSRFRSKLIKNQKPTIRCMFDGCRRHDLHLRTLSNIWRPYLELCPEPGVYYKNSQQTEYPVAWKERVSIVTQDIVSPSQIPVLCQKCLEVYIIPIHSEHSNIPHMSHRRSIYLIPL
jgi:hypothetical protein